MRKRMSSGTASSFGKVQFGIGWFGWLFLGLAAIVAYGTIIRGSGWTAPLFGMIFLGFGVWVNRKSILRIPAVETNDSGVFLRPATGKGCVYVKWPVISEVVIWHHGKGGQKSTMVGVKAPRGFSYDNYEKYPLVRPYGSPRTSMSVPQYVGPTVARWSVNVAAASPRKIAALIQDSGHNVPVKEVSLWSEEVRNLTGP
jgi:hypothetical protein